MATIPEVETFVTADLKAADLRNSPLHQPANYYRDLAYRVRMLQHAPAEPYALAVTACAPRAGVSTVAANLALAFSESIPGRCLLVDANVHTPALHKAMQVDSSPGLLDFLADRSELSDCVYRVATPDNLFFLPVGHVRNSPRAFDPMVLGDGMELLKRFFDVLVLDLPATNEPSEGLPVARATDGVLLVVEAERIRRHAALRGKERLEAAGARVVGTVLTKRRKYIPNWMYHFF